MTLSRPWDPFSPHLPEPETLSTEPVLVELHAGQQIEPVVTYPVDTVEAPSSLPAEPEPVPAPIVQTKPTRTRGTRAGRQTTARKASPRKRLDAALKKMEGQ
jgi:hypothetical protein